MTIDDTVQSILNAPTDSVSINQLPTGVPGLDEVLGGGIPEYSFNLIAGAPGTGKTTLAADHVWSRHAGAAGLAFHRGR